MKGEKMRNNKNRLLAGLALMVVIVFYLLPLTATFGGTLPDTGQNKCYDDDSEITCPNLGQDFYGQDGNYDINTQSYTKLDANGNDLPDEATEWVMVRDKVTGLIWENKTDDGSIHDRDNYYNWYDAQSVFIATLNSQNFGGHNDWRLPTIKELSTIVDSSIPSPGPTINSDYFPNTVSSNYWSSTTIAPDPRYAWVVGFYDGDLRGYGKSGSGYYVRAVRSGQCGSFGDFVDNGDGTITDTETGLMWQKDTDPGNYTWQPALSYCENLTLAGYNDWRLPNRNELQSIVDYSRYNPAIDPIFNVVSSGYWSSTTSAGSPAYAWIVYFYNGDIYDYDKSNDYDYYVRAVRSGQCGSFGDLDDDCRIDCIDNCLSTPNGLDLGTCTKGTISQSCTSNEQCGTNGFCSREQEDTDSDYLGDACDECTDTDKDGYGNPGFLINTCPVDNCPFHPNGSGLGTCTKDFNGIIIGTGIDCTPSGNECGDGETCQLEQGDWNNNGVGDVCECYADLDGSGDVYPGDAMIMIAEWGREDCLTNPPCQADIDGDGLVYPSDAMIMLEQWGREDCPVLP